MPSRLYRDSRQYRGVDSIPIIGEALATGLTLAMANAGLQAANAP